LQTLKIIHISTYATGGAGIAAYRIHEALLENGIASRFLCMDNSMHSTLKECYRFPRPTYSLYQRLINKANRVFNRYYFLGKLIPSKYFNRRLSSIRSRLICDVASLPFSTINILEHPLVKNADIIHLHWVAGMLDYPSFFEENIKPVVWTFHDLNPALGLFHYMEDEKKNEDIAGELNNDVVEFKKNIIQKRKFNLNIICPSRWLLNGISKSNIVKYVTKSCIPYPINTAIFSPKKTDILRESLNIPSDNTIFLFVSQTVVHYRKGFDLLIAALQQIQSNAITLLTVGYAVEENLLACGLNIINMGVIGDEELLSNYYSLADAFIIPSREDNLPNVMLESLACGTPVLCFNTGGMATVIKDLHTGLKASEINANSLQEVIQQFIKEKHQFSSDSIRNFAIDNYSNQHVAQQYREVYKALLIE